MSRLRVAVAGVVGVCVGYAAWSHYASRVRRARDRAADLRRALDPDGVVGSGRGEEFVLAVLGDSSAAGDGLEDVEDTLGRQLAERLTRATGRRVRIHALAASGARSADVRTQQVPRLPRSAVQAVALVVGVNDALAGHPPRRVESDTGLLLAAVRRAAPGARIVLLACPNLRRAPAVPPGLGVVVHLATTLTARAQQRAAQRWGVSCVRLSGPPAPRHFAPDGLHPGPHAVGIIADELADALAGGRVRDS